MAAGLPAELVLLEEPQAALYAWLADAGDRWQRAGDHDGGDHEIAVGARTLDAVQSLLPGHESVTLGMEDAGRFLSGLRRRGRNLIDMLLFDRVTKDNSHGDRSRPVQG